MSFVFDVTAFRVSFPAFANTTTYPDATLQGYWNTATCYISSQNYGYLNGAPRDQALNLMTAHLAVLNTAVNTGKMAGIVTQAGIDKISLSLQVPPSKNQWEWWLNLTQYGQQLLALLQVLSTGGFTIGGYPELAAFRKTGGLF